MVQHASIDAYLDEVFPQLHHGGRTSTTSADHDLVRIFGRLDQEVGRMAFRDRGLNGQLGVLLTDAIGHLRDDALRLLLQHLFVVTAFDQ